MNDSLLPNSTLESGFPRKVCLETARKWLHQLGFEVLTTQKGILLMDMSVVMLLNHASSFYVRWSSWAFFILLMLPLRIQQTHYLLILTPLQVKGEQKQSFSFMTSQSSCRTRISLLSGVQKERKLKPKSKGSGIMVSHFGFLAFSDEEYEIAKTKHPNIRKYAREFLEYGEIERATGCMTDLLHR